MWFHSLKHNSEISVGVHHVCDKTSTDYGVSTSKAHFFCCTIILGFNCVCFKLLMSCLPLALKTPKVTTKANSLSIPDLTLTLVAPNFFLIQCNIFKSILNHGIDKEIYIFLISAASFMALCKNKSQLNYLCEILIYLIFKSKPKFPSFLT